MPITLVQITDTHIHDQSEAEFKGTNPYLNLQRIVRHINSTVKNLDCLIVTGDLTHDGSANACRNLAHCLSDFKCPIYITPGNHDDTQIIQQYLVGGRITMPAVVELGNWRLIFADSHIDGQTGGYINPAAMEQISAQLDQHEQPSLLLTHHPPLKINSQWMDKIGMQNGDQLLGCLAQYKHLKAIVFGHIHQHWDSQVDHLRLLGSPSTCVQFKPLSEDFGIDTLAPGYRIIHLLENGFDTQIVRCPVQIKKIVSGGQTGVDRAALDCAIELAIPHGGWCPRGRRAVDGPLDAIYRLTETPSAGYPQRTEWNIRDADATLVLGWGPPDGGTALTVNLARQMQKSLLIIDLQAPAPIDSVSKWLHEHQVQVLNVAGPRHSKADKIYALARQYLHRILCNVT